MMTGNRGLPPFLSSSFALDARTAQQRLQECATSDGNIFGELLDTVQMATMGQITSALYQVVGHYRRSMWIKPPIWPFMIYCYSFLQGGKDNVYNNPI
jgi:hypothetical protein